MRHSNDEISARLKAIINNAIDGIITIDTSGIMEQVNPAAASIFGYEPTEMIGQNVNVLMPSYHATHHDGYIGQYLKTGNKKIIGIGRQVEGMKKDGSRFPFKLSVSEVLFGNKRLFTGVIHDISKEKKAEARLQKLNTDLERLVEERTNELGEVVQKLLNINRTLESEIKTRKKAEQALRMSEADLKTSLAKERELNELKSRFVAMASHEFRTPLSTIFSSASLIARYEELDMQEKRVRHIDRIKSNVGHLNGILNDFLSLGKIEEGKFDFFPEPIHLRVLCKEIKEELRTILKSGQDIEVTFNGSDDIFISDRRMLKQVFYNLLSNGIKYSGNNTVVQCDILNEAHTLIITISDQGVGIGIDDQKHLFKRFFRAKNVINISGTGLGLNIVKRYVDFLGGTISFKSKLNEGSTFTVVLKKNQETDHG